MILPSRINIKYDIFLLVAWESMELNRSVLVVTREPLAGASLTNLLFLLQQNRFNIDIRYIPRMLYAIAISSIMTPLRIREFIHFDNSINSITIDKPPLFILGHWRSGTTYLHNVLSLDSAFGYFSTLHASVPGVFLGHEALIKSFVKTSLPDKRPMDDVLMGPDLPQEDEFALAASSPYSANHGLCFPRNSECYNRFIFMDDVSQKIKDEWKEIYLYLIKKETWYWQGRRLVIKNPANTARVQLLLEMFPEARFIHISRNPYHVYLSMLKLLRSIVPFMCVQKPPEEPEIERRVLQVYKRMYMNYLKQRTRIPKGNLIEIRYEDFIHHPLDQLRNIYSQLHLSGFRESEKKFAQYIASQAKVKTQTYVLSDRIKETIYSEWKFAFDSFHYEK